MILIIFIILMIVAVLIQTKISHVKHVAKITRTDSLLRASLQWLQASKEDRDPVTALVHSSSASSLLNAARSQMADEDIELFYPKLNDLIRSVKRQEVLCVSQLKKQINKQR
jgi:hypothetical protein